MLACSGTCLGSVISVLLCAQLAAGQQSPGNMTITVVQGNGVINNVRQLRPEPPIVKVLDASGRPIKGAAVTFRAPESGASATFKGGKKTLTTTTDDDGQATATGFRPNKEIGQFNIQVSAAYAGGETTANLAQTNGKGVEAAKKKVGAGVIVLIVVVAVVAAFGLRQVAVSNSKH
jgi:hypothetical protein